MLAAIAFMPFATISVVPMSIMDVVNPVSGRAPVSTGPDPMVVAPTPASADPDVSWRGAHWRRLHDRSRHGWLHISWSGRHDHWRRKRDAEVEPEMNSGIRIRGAESDYC